MLTTNHTSMTERKAQRPVVTVCISLLGEKSPSQSSAKTTDSPYEAKPIASTVCDRNVKTKNVENRAIKKGKKDSNQCRK